MLVNTQVAVARTGFTAPVGGGGGSLIWASAFDYATGTSLDALADGPSGSANWERTAYGQGKTIVSAAGLDFGSTNCLEMRLRTATSGWGVTYSPTTPFPTMGIGSSRYWRFKLRFAMSPGLSDNQTHPIETDNSEVWGLGCFTTTSFTGATLSSTEWQPFLFTASGMGASFPNASWYFPVMTRNVTYRFEVRITRTSSTGFTMSGRVYNSAGTLLYDDDDMRNSNNTQSLSAYSGGFNAGSEALFNTGAGRWYCGNNGQGGTDWADLLLHSHQGCFAVSDTDWCGEYTPGEGP